MCAASAGVGAVSRYFPMRGCVPNEKTSAAMGLMHHRLACGGTIETPSVGSSIRPLGFGTGVSLPQLTVRGVKVVEAHPLSSTPTARIQVNLVTGLFAVPSARAGRAVDLLDVAHGLTLRVRRAARS